MEHVIDCPERGHNEEATEPGCLTRKEFVHEAVNDICLKLDREVPQEEEERRDLKCYNHHIDASVGMLHLENEDIGEEHAVHIDMMATSPEVKRLSILHLCVLCCPEADEKNHCSLCACIGDPNPKLFHVEDEIMHSDTVKNWRVHEDFLFKLKVEQSIPDVVQSCEGHIIDLVDPLFIHSLT